MSQTLLIEGNEQRGSMLSLNLQVYTGTNVIWKQSIAEAVEVLNVLPQINLILALDDKLGPVDSLLTCMEEKDLSIPFISSVGELLKGAVGEHIIQQDDFDINKIIQLAGARLGVAQIDIVKKILPDYFPIAIDSFKYINEIVCDVYIKLKRPDGSARYVKRMSQGDLIDEDTISRYIIKQVDKLYVLKEDRFVFTDAFSSSIVSKLKEGKLAVSEKVQLVNSASEVIRLIFQNEEINESDVELIENSIATLEQICHASPKLSDLIKGLLEEKNSFRYQLMTVTAYLGVKAIKRKGVANVSVLSSQVEKFVQACFLHDILLVNDDQVRVRSEEDIERYHIVEKELVLTHALKTSELVKALPNISDDVVRIILEHHGKPTGSGFSFEFLSRLHPLSLVLIACENYAHEILDYQGKSFNYDDIVKELPPIFLKKEFWKIISNLG